MRLKGTPVILLALLTELGGCGAGGNPSAVSSSISGSTGTVSIPVSAAPPAGAERIFAETLVDNLNNTFHRTKTSNVTLVNADGTFTVHEEDPSHDSVSSGSVDHTLYPADLHFDAQGNTVDYVVTRRTNIVHCNFSNRTDNAPRQLTVGASWTRSYTLTCDGGAPVVYTQSSAVINEEPVTVAAGTFNTYKIASTLTFTLMGTTHTETATRWRNADAPQPEVLKETVDYSYSGNPPPSGALTSFTAELQSYR